MLKQIKKITQNPENIYETNFVLCILLKYLFIFPIKINLKNHKINLNRTFLIIQLLTIIFIISNIFLNLYTDGLGLIFNKVNIIGLFQYITIIISTVILSISCFSVVTKLDIFFYKIFIFDKYFNKAEVTSLNKIINHRNIYIFIFILLSQTYLTIFECVYGDNITFYHMYYSYVTIIFPVHNIFLVTYSQVNFVYMINQRLQLISDRIKIKYEVYKLYSLDNNLIDTKFDKVELQMISILCDIIDEFNYGFGTVIYTAIISGFITVVYFTYVVFSYLLYDHILWHYIIYYLWLSIEAIVMIFLLFNECYKTRGKVISSKI